MAIFSVPGLSDETAKQYLADAAALTTYSYHNLDSGLENGYEYFGFGLEIPLTLVTAIFGNEVSEGIIAGLPWAPDSEQQARDTINQAGWYTIDPETLGYKGTTDARGTYFGENAMFSTSEVEVMGKYDEDGSLVQIGICFRGTSGPRENLILDTASDALHDLLAGVLTADFANDFAKNAFNDLLGKVAAYAEANGLTGDDVLVTGHSLGGLAVNSMASLSEDNWNSFYSQAHYIAFASPTQYEEGGKVLNIGFENDPVFRALDGTDLTVSSFFTHDSNYNTTTDNIVNFNDYYSSAVWNALPQSIVNIASWISHVPFFYQNSMERILDSEFYSLTERDSNIVVANLSDVARSSTWVEDLNRYAEEHTGTTFILGSDKDDLIKGGQGNDYLEGSAGNDIFQDEGGYNIISGGEGVDKLALQHSLGEYNIAYDGETLYLRDAAGGITQASGVEMLSSLESFLWIFNSENNYEIIPGGLHNIDTNELTLYSSSVNGNQHDNILQSNETGSWLFGHEGNDMLIGRGGDTTFVGGAGNDQLYSAAGHNTFIFNGEFGHDIIGNFSATDKILITSNAEATGIDIHDVISETDGGLLIDLGASSVTLVGMTMSALDDAQVIVA
jgi:Ca2+-binding RTX toxin-like protein